jgi:hypothetical protein
VSTYSDTLVFCYQLSLSIELAYKVCRPHIKAYLIPLRLHHLTCNLLGLTLALIAVTLGEFEWSAENGCDKSKTATIA